LITDNLLPRRNRRLAEIYIGGHYGCNLAKTVNLISKAYAIPPRIIETCKKSHSESEGDRTAPHFGSSAVRGPIEPDHIERAVSAARASGSTVAVISTADRDRWPTNQAYREDVWDPPAD